MIIDFYLKIIDINLSRFLSIDNENRYSSMIEIDYYRLSSILGLSIDYVWINWNQTLLTKNEEAETLLYRRRTRPFNSSPRVTTVKVLIPLC